VGLGWDFVFPPGPILARSAVALHLDPTVARIFSSNKIDTAAGPLTGARAYRWVDAPPSSGSSTEPYPHAAVHPGDSRLSDGRRTAPPWAPSAARTPTDGWTCHHQAAPRWGPTRAHPQDLGVAVFWSSTTRRPELRRHLSHGAPSTGGDHGEARARSWSSASRSIHPACGSTTAGGSGHGIFTKR
jgi:hypothetical protein